MYTDSVVEIDLYTHLKRERFTYYGELEEIRIFVPRPLGFSVTFRLRSTRQRYGVRMHFLCPYCKRRTQKLYVHYSPFKEGVERIACRICYKLKYSSQYQKNPLFRAIDIAKKISDLERTRTLYYNGKPTQYGRRYERLRSEVECLTAA